MESERVGVDRLAFSQQVSNNLKIGELAPTGLLPFGLLRVNSAQDELGFL